MTKRNEKKRNPILGLFLLLILVLIIVGIGVFGWFMNMNRAVDNNDTQPVALTVPSGYGEAGIASLLKENGLIRSELVFRIVVRLEGLEGQLQAGNYAFSRSQTPNEIAQGLLHGTEVEIIVTIPEGKRREEVAKILKDTFAEYGSAFSLAEFMKASEGAEGYLFPDTYHFDRTATATEVVAKMRETFDLKIPDEKKVLANQLGLSFQEVLILASLVEREAKFEVDRPMIARVMLNRLDLGMALQIDATVQYAVGEARCKAKIGYDCDWWPVLNNTEYDSLYNTYQNPGLPPAPIANPGLAVVDAVLTAEDHDYLYYLSEDSGKTYYSETLEEHEAKIEKYLR